MDIEPATRMSAAARESDSGKGWADINCFPWKFP